MNPDLMRAAGYVIGLVVSLPIATAGVKVVMFVGKATTTLDGVARSIEKTTATLEDHAERIAVVETRVDGIERQQPGARPFPNYRPEPSR